MQNSDETLRRQIQYIYKQLRAEPDTVSTLGGHDRTANEEEFEEEDDIDDEEEDEDYGDDTDPED
jgi:hypothetical protein